MIKSFLAIFSLFLITSCGTKAIENTPENEIKRFQQELNAVYLNEKETPLRGENYAKFKQHPFFPIDLKYRVKAKLVKAENSKPFEIPTSSGKTKTYREYAKAHFSIDGKPQTLTIYQNLANLSSEQYKDYLFLPFRDVTNGKDTYGGGKYIDLRIPEGDEIIIDFNKSYHPYCAYNAYDYSCPIVPEENNLPIEIRAGVMYEDIWFE